MNRGSPQIVEYRESGPVRVGQKRPRSEIDSLERDAYLVSRLCCCSGDSVRARSTILVFVLHTDALYSVVQLIITTTATYPHEPATRLRSSRPSPLRRCSFAPFISRFACPCRADHRAAYWPLQLESSLCSNLAADRRLGLAARPAPSCPRRRPQMTSCTRPTFVMSSNQSTCWVRRPLRARSAKHGRCGSSMRSAPT